MPQVSTNEIFDPTVVDWVESKNRVDEIKLELASSIDLLLWNNSAYEVVKKWVKREFAKEYLSSNFFWSDELKSQKFDTAKSIFLEANPNKDLSRFKIQDVEAWLLGKDIEREWSQKNWSHRLETIYLGKKDELDVVSCALIRVKNQNLAFELYQRLRSQEASFDQLSWQFGEGPEKNQGGRFVRQRISTLPQPLRPLLRKLKIGDVLKPHRLGDWFFILVLEEFFPAQFDLTTKQFLLDEEFDNWLHAVTRHLLNHLKS